MSSSVLGQSANLLLTDQEFQKLSLGDKEYYLWLLKNLAAQLKKEKLLLYLPNPKQQAFHQALQKIRVTLGGNRSGKTTCGVVEFLWHILGMYPDWYPQSRRYKRAVKGRIFCEDFQKAGAKVILPAINDWMDDSYVAKKTRNPMGFPINWEMKNGSSFEILTYEQKTAQYEGWKGDVAWFDEPPPRDKYIATLRGLVDSGGRAWLTLTPLSQPWILDELVEAPDKHRVFATRMDIRDNLIRMENGIQYGHLTEENIKDYEASLSPDEKEARIHGKFFHLTGRVFKQFDAEKHVVSEMDIKPHWTRFMAVDPHPSTPTACLWMAVDEKNQFWVYDELFLSDMDTKEISAAIHAQEGPYPAHMRFIDPAMDKDNKIFGGLNVRKEFMKRGVYTVRANNDWDYGKDAIDRAITPKWSVIAGQDMPQLRIVGPSCPRLLYEITHYIWDKGKGKTEKQKPIKKDDHLIDCLRYILASDPHYMIQDEDEEDSGPSFKGDYTKYPTKSSMGRSKSYRDLVE